MMINLVHGEATAQEILRDRLKDELGVQVALAEPGMSVDLAKPIRIAA